MDKKPALGKGLSALIPDAAAAADQPRGALEVDIDQLEPNRHQPRSRYDEARLAELAQSISANGIIQPIVVRRLPAGDAGLRPRFQIVAGERRWRAAQLAGRARVPVVVTDLGDADARGQLELALIENVQREDLNPIEQARAYQRLAEEFGLRQEDIAARVGKDRATVANTTRLLRLPADLQAHVADGTLSMGHARAILGLTAESDQRRVAADVITRSLSVRETELLVKRETARPSPATSPGTRPAKDVHTRAAEEQLHLALGAPVTIHRRRRGGTIEIAFSNEDDLQRIYEYLTGRH